MLQRAVDRDPQVVEVQRLGHEVECAAVHGRADVLHVAVGGDDHGADVRVDRGDLLQQRQAVHLGHVDVREDHIDVIFLAELLEGLHAVAGEDELVEALPDGAAHALEHEGFEIGFVVNDQDLVGHRVI